MEVKHQTDVNIVIARLLEHLLNVSAVKGDRKNDLIDEVPADMLEERIEGSDHSRAR